MSQKVYRNIILSGTRPSSFHGTIDVYYYGNIIMNAQFIKNLNVDPEQDLVVVCGSCDAKKYRNFIKTNR